MRPPKTATRPATAAPGARLAAPEEPEPVVWAAALAPVEDAPAPALLLLREDDDMLDMPLLDEAPEDEAAEELGTMLAMPLAIDEVVAQLEVDGVE